MTQSSLVDLARGGDPYAIAVLLNQALHPKGVTARAALTDDCLHILLESEQASPQPDVMPMVSKGILQLQPDAIAKTIVYARQKGQGKPDWTKQLKLEASNLPSSPLSANIDAETIDLEVLSPQPGLEILDEISPISTGTAPQRPVPAKANPSEIAENSWDFFLAIAVLLIFFFPAGLYLIWYQTRWSVALKCITSTIPAIVLLSALLAYPKLSPPPNTPTLPASPTHAK